MIYYPAYCEYAVLRRCPGKNREEGRGTAVFAFADINALRAEQNERRPNRYVASALQIGLMGMLFCLLLNEINVFHVDKTVMRVCASLGVVCSLIPQGLAGHDRLSVDPRTKFIILFCVCGMCFAMSLALFLFAVPLCALPMLLAAQYNSRRLSYIAIAGSSLCVAVAPPLGCAMGLWDSEFLRFLISSAWGREMWIAPATESGPGIMTTGPLGVVMYISFPWLLITLLLGKLILTVTRKGEENIETRVKVIRMSQLDALTGLYNQNIYNQYLKSPVDGDETVGVLFFDVDGLKRVNDDGGHEQGDLLLRRCAESLRDILDDSCHGFRIGGDEFLAVVDTDDPAVLDEKLELWQKAMDRINLENRTRHKGLVCHMSVGSAFGKKYDLPELIVRADTKMYAQKEAYHKAQGWEVR